MTQVAFKVQGGHAFGMGHVNRSLCLADTLRECGADVRAFFCNEDAVSCRLINERGYQVRLCDFETANKANIYATCFTGNRGILVIDQPLPQSALLAELKRHTNDLFLIALDYMDMEERNLDLIVSLFNHHPRLREPKFASIAYVEGVAYAIIDQKFDSYIAKKKKIKPKAGNILISFGGSDPGQHTLRVLEELRLLKEPDLDFHVVVGPNFVHRGSIRRKADDLQVSVHLYESPANLAELMFMCDFGFVGAGTMMMEMAAVGTPAIVLPQNENETRFGRFFAAQRAAVLFDFAVHCPIEPLPRIVDRMVHDFSERSAMSEIGKSLVDGKGRYRIADLIQTSIREE
jgi:UDP-2,4-diacetamido-2,4,6-trideoxy-beta-L-altropyranose hydrolase